MSEPTPTRYIDLRLDDSKTEAEILALPNGDNKAMVASDTNAVYLVDDNGNKKQWGFVHRSTIDPTVSNDDSEGFSAGDSWFQSTSKALFKCDDNSTGAAAWTEVGSGAVLSDGITVTGDGSGGNPLIAPGTRLGTNVDVIDIPATERLFGSELIPNSDFQNNVSGWSVGNAGVLSWQAGGLARLAYTITASPYMFVANLIVGETYTVNLRLRTDGVVVPRFLDLSGTHWTGIASTDFDDNTVTFEFVAAGTSSTIQALTAIAGYLEVDYIHVNRKTISLVNEKNESVISRANGLIYPEDFSNAAWLKANVLDPAPSGIKSLIVDVNGEPIEYQTIVANAVSGDHAIYQLYTGDGVPDVCTFGLRGGSSEWMMFLTSTPTTQRVWINMDTGEVGALTNMSLNDVSVNLVGRDMVVSIKTLSAVGSDNVRFYCTNGDGLLSAFVGDAVNPQFYLAATFTYKGEVSDNVKYINSAGVPVTQSQKVESVLDLMSKWKSGFKQRTDAYRGPGSADGWEPEQKGTDYFSTPFDSESAEKIVCIGDSITDGLGDGYPERLQQMYPEKTIVNLGISGVTTEDMVANDNSAGEDVQVLPAIGRYFWDFSDPTVWPFTSVNSAVLAITAETLKIEQGASADPSAQLRIMNAGMRVRIKGSIAGDGVSIPEIVSTDTGTIWALGSASTTPVEFNFIYQSTVADEGIQFLVTGGIATSFVSLHELTFELEVQPTITTNILMAMSGTNDVAQLDALADIKERQDFISRQAHLNGIRAVWLNVTPSNSFASWTATERQKIIDLNAWQYGASLADCAVDTSAMGDINRDLLAKWNSGDNLHPNAAGYYFLAEIVSNLYFSNRTFVTEEQRHSHGYAQLSSYVSGVVDGWEVPQASDNATQYVYRASASDRERFGDLAVLMVFDALLNADTLGAATKIHTGTLILSNGVKRITTGLDAYDGTNSADIHLTGTGGSGTITVALSGYTIIGGSIVYE